MSKTKYQIFVSSTYNDLREERDQVIKACLEMGHIPVGMEMFSTTDEDQWQIATRQIDESDYYVIIVANRYGSIVNGSSYIEKEYDYAISKSVPTLAFILDPKAKWPSAHSEIDKNAQIKLDTFKKKILSKSVFFWKTKEELKTKFIIGLTSSIAANPRPGWQAAAQSISKVTPIKTLRFAIITLILAFTAALIINLVGGARDFDSNISRVAHYLKSQLDNQNFSFASLAIILFATLLSTTKTIYDNLLNKTTNRIEDVRLLSSGDIKKYWGKQYIRHNKLSTNNSESDVKVYRSTIGRSVLKSGNQEREKVDIESKSSINQIITSEFDASRSRLIKEINKIESRGLLNLVIGIVTTLTAITVLIVSIVYTPKITDLNELLRYYVPKVTFSLFVEIFAFFFLRLYRSSLIDIKYYQNELTNIDMKAVSLKVLALQEGPDTLNQVCIDISKTERNSIIKEAEILNTTMIAKNETNSDKYFSGIIQSLIEKIPKSDSTKEKTD